jgi:hypothetical protein
MLFILAQINIYKTKIHTLQLGHHLYGEWSLVKGEYHTLEGQLVTFMAHEVSRFTFQGVFLKKKSHGSICIVKYPT